MMFGVQAAPKWLPNGPTTAPNRPRRPLRPPKTAQEAPKTAQEGVPGAFPTSAVAQGSLKDTNIFAQGSPVGDKRGYNYPLGVVKKAIERSMHGSNTPMGRRPGEFLLLLLLSLLLIFLHTPNSKYWAVLGPSGAVVGAS